MAQHDRRTALGSSDVAPALGLSRHKTPLELWLDKTASERDDTDSPAMRRGRFLEAAILARYGIEAGVAVEPGRTLTADWRRAQIDGFAAGRVVEAKSVAKHVFRERFGAPGTDDLPDEYLCQTLWQIDMAGVQEAHVPVAVLPDDPDMVLGATPDEVLAVCELHVYVVTRKDSLIDVVRERCAAFWRDHVVARVAPAPQTYEDAQRLWWQSAGGKTVAATKFALDALTWLDFARSAKKVLGELEDRAKFALACALQDGETLIGPDGSPYLQQKIQHRKSYVVAESESKPLRFLKGWKSTETARHAEARVAELTRAIRAALPAPLPQTSITQEAMP
jgi:putative phage-type endonuclease